MDRGFSLRHYQRIEAGRSVTLRTIWKLARAFDVRPLVNAVQAVAPHARFLALLDRGGHPQDECDQASRLLTANAVDTFWLQQGELESFWTLDTDFCVRLCELASKAAGVENSSEKIKTSIQSSSASQTAKASTMLEGVLAEIGVRTSKVKLAELALRLMAEESGERPKTALIAELLRALHSKPKPAAS